jgi:hypothetical protein
MLELVHMGMLVMKLVKLVVMLFIPLLLVLRLVKLVLTGMLVVLLVVNNWCF